MQLPRRPQLIHVSLRLSAWWLATCLCCQADQQRVQLHYTICLASIEGHRSFPFSGHALDAISVPGRTMTASLEVISLLGTPASRWVLSSSDASKVSHDKPSAVGALSSTQRPTPLVTPDKPPCLGFDHSSGVEYENAPQVPGVTSQQSPGPDRGQISRVESRPNPRRLAKTDRSLGRLYAARSRPPLTVHILV